MPSAKNNWNEIPYTSVNCCKAGDETAENILPDQVGSSIGLS